MDEKEQEESLGYKGINFVWEITKFIFIAGAIVIPFRMYIAQPFIVNGASMLPTFENGQYLIVDQLSYHFEKPTRGAVIIFRYPLNQDLYFIKRVIGLPGETVSINGGGVVIKNKANPNGILLNEQYIKYPKEDYLTFTLSATEYFVMGDNRDGSSDSRIWGPVDENLIIGRPLIRLLPVQTLDIFPGYDKDMGTKKENNN